MAKKKIYEIIYNSVVKYLKTRKGNVTSLPNTNEIQAGMRSIFRKLKDGGYNPASADRVIKNEADLNRVLREIDQPSRRDTAVKAYEEVMDKVRTGAPLNPSDRAKLEAAGFKPDESKDLFKGFEPRVIEGGKSKTSFTDMVQNEIEGVKLYGDETFDEIEFIRKNKKHPRDEKAKGGLVKLIKKFLKESKSKKSGDKIYGVGGEEIDVADLKKSLGLDEATDKKNMQDLEDFMTEGRGVYQKEADEILKQNKGLDDEQIMQKAYDEIKGGSGFTDDYKYDADLLAEEYAKQKGVVYTDLPQDQISIYYEPALKRVQQDMFKRIEAKKALKDVEQKIELQMFDTKGRKPNALGGLIAAVKKLNKKYGKDTIKKAKDMKRPKKAIEKEELEQLFKNFKKKYGFAGGGVAHMLGYADGDRVPAFKGGLMKLLKAMGENNPAQAYRKYLASVKRRSQEGDFKSLAPELGAVAGGGILANRALTRKIKEISQQERDAFYDRLAAEYKEKYKDDPEMLRIMLEGLEKRRQEKPVRGMYSEGGMSRRTFLKIMGAIAAFPVVGKFFKGAKIANKVPPMVTQTKDMPAHFPKLVEKILKRNMVSPVAV